VDRFIKTIIRAKADDFLSMDENEYVIASPLGNIVLETGSGTSVWLTIGASLGNDRFIARVSDDLYLNGMGSWLIDRLFKPLSEFTEKK